MRMSFFVCLCLFCVFLCVLCDSVVSSSQSAQPAHISFKVGLKPVDPFSDQNAAGAESKFEVRRGETFLVTIEGAPEESWHTYPIGKHTESQSTAQLSQVRLSDGKEFAALWPIAESEPELKPEEGTSGLIYEYEKPFTWTMEVLARPEAAPGTHNLEINLRMQVCDPKGCVTEKQTLSVPVQISTAAAVPLSSDVERLLKSHDEALANGRRQPAGRTDQAGRTAQSADAGRSQQAFNWQEYQVVNSPSLESVSGGGGEGGLWATIVTAILGGFISLLTPCVFPMIPVTVSFFLKQGEREHHRPLTMAAVYCATIVAVLTAGGIALVHVLQVISQHWITNVFLTGVFVFFALSLLGMYEIELPSGLANLTGSREGKGGLVGIVFMALTFSIISFACVGPIYGAFITLEASQSVVGWLQRILGPLAFALAFASPFFVLALFPTLLRSMPKSGSWMNSVKVVMGFLELAAAFKFVRAAELNFLAASNYFTFDLVLGIYVALAVACGLYLLNVYRLPHDHDAAESIGVPRLVFGLVFLSFAFYLLPGIFKDDKGKSQKPRGVAYEWVSAFLLPDDRSSWGTDLAAALERAEREQKPLFIDFTGLG
ncbi:MAG TPA: cytochrome c biogenesis protein CcdA [Gemmataceae bacterium]|nr:cytochrome c biogenesis protein CcdA [Gemmataceae bacterium]